MPVLPFETKIDIVSFAKRFLRMQVLRFRKDISVCLRGRRLRPREPLTHAYFPGLMTCIAFVDLLSGLYAGKIDGHSVGELKSFVKQFMDKYAYDDDTLDILYQMFRHKVAHLAIPYAVFDTHAKGGPLKSRPRRLLTWTVHAGRRKPSIKIEPLASAKQIQHDPTPWDTYYDHRVSISVKSLATDIVKSIYGPTGYLHCLRTDAAARARFKNCMKLWYPNP